MNDTTDAESYSNNGGGVNNLGTMTMSGGMIAKNNGKGGVYSGAQDSQFVMTGGAVFENYALTIFGENVPEESKKLISCCIPVIREVTMSACALLLTWRRMDILLLLGNT